MGTTKSLWPYWLLYFVVVDIFSTQKYGLVGASFKSTIACESNMMHLRCPHKSLVLKIFSATYGRLLSKRNICASNDPSHVLKDCGENNVMPKVEELCKVKTECSFTVNNKNFGQYCVNVYKYLIVVYSCVPRPTTVEPPSTLPTTQATTTPKPTAPTTATLNITTSANSTTGNTTSIIETTPRSQPVDYGSRNRRYTNRPKRPAIETYDRGVFRRNHGTSSRHVSSLHSVGNFGISFLVLLLFDVYLLRVT